MNIIMMNDIMKKEPEIVKELKKAEKLGTFNEKSQMLNDTFKKASGDIFFEIKNTVKNARNNLQLGSFEEKFKRIFENYAVAITLVDNNERIISWNKYAEELFNMNETDLFMQPVEILYPPNEWKKIRAENIRQKGMKYRLETKLTRKNQGFFDAELSLCVLKDNNDNIIGSIGIIKDITKLKETEKELEESEEKFRQLYENAPIPYHTLSAEGIITDVNEKWCQTLGYSKKEVIGRSIFNFIDESEKKSARLSFNHKILSKKYYLKGHERKYISKSGEEKIFVINDFLLYDNNHNIKFVQTTMEDITLKKKRFEEFKELKNHFQQLFNSMIDPVAIVDNKGKILEVTKKVEKVTGFKRDELVNNNFLKTKIFSNKTKTILIKNLLKRMSGIKIPPYEIEILTKNGDKLPFEINAEKIVYMGTLADMVVFRDISQRKKAEKDLKDSEERYRDLFENANDLIQAVKPDGSFLYVNDAWKKVLGYTDKEIKNISIFDIIHPESKEHCMKIFKRVISGESFDNVEASFISKNGNVVFVEGSVNCRFVDGKPFATRGIYRDVTINKQAERDLQQNEKRLKAIMENILTGVLIIEAETHKIVDANPTAIELIGIPRDKIVGQICHKFICTAEVGKCPITDLGRTVDKSEQILINGDGEKVLILKTVTPITLNGKEYLIDSFIDITDQKKVENKIKNIIKSSPSGIITVDKVGKITSWSPKCEEIFGWKEEEVIGKFNPTIPNNMKDYFLKTMSEERTNIEIKLLKKDSSMVDVSLSTAPLYDEEGNSIGVLGVMTDISRRKQVEEQLNKAHDKLKIFNKKLEKKVKERTIEVEKLLKQKDAFINQLSHDLRSPLTPLIALLPGIEEKENDPDLKGQLGVINRNVNFLSKLVEKTIELARVNSPQTKINLENITLLKEIEKVVEENRHLFNEKNIEITNTVDKKININVDKMMINELFNNLISNAIKYSKKGGKIIIDAKDIDDWITVSIKDNGIGLDKKELTHIFEEFYKADWSRHDHKSSGLGLSICKTIVNKHNGRIWAESVGKGEGTTIYFSLPSQRKTMV